MAQILKMLAAALAISQSGPVQGRPGGDLIIQDVTLISPERPAPFRHADVLIRSGRIAGIGRHLVPPGNGRRIDGRGRFLIPGLVDSHVHVGHSAALTEDEVERHADLWASYRAQVPRAYLAFGFTTIVDLDDSPDALRWFQSAPLRPNFHHCGRGVRVAGGYGAQRLPADRTAPSFPNLVFEPAEAGRWPAALPREDYTPERAVARAANSGATCLKVFVEPGFGIFDWPIPHAATLTALRRAATARGLVMIVHATGPDSWQAALGAHADIIAHGMWVWPGNLRDSDPPAIVRETIAAAARSGVRVQPTLQVTAGERALLDRAILDDPKLVYALPQRVIGFLRSDEAQADARTLLAEYRSSAPAPAEFEPLLASAIARSRATFGLMLEDHVRILLGSDTPAGDGIGNPPGLNGRLEIQDWAEAGASPRQIFRAATLDNATALGLDRMIGTIEVGKRADLLLLGSNPLRDVGAYDTIRIVFLAGRPIPRESLRARD